MNQILVTKKLYITPELKKKKKAYKVYFILSVFLICILVSFYIYAEYDRNKGEEASASLLADFNQETTEMNNKKNVLVAVLDGTDEGTDTGPIIAQKAVEVLPGDTPEILQKRVMEQAEWKILPKAIDDIANNRI